MRKPAEANAVVATKTARWPIANRAKGYADVPKGDMTVTDSLKLSIVVLVLCLIAGCGHRSTNTNAAIVPDILIVLPDAENVKNTREYDGTVSYQLRDPYPADKTIGEIRSRLEGHGWKPATDDLMNPGMKNSHERGWMNFIDGTRNDANVFLWAAAWESTRGDRVEYWLRYEYAKESGPMSAKAPLQLSAVYMTAPTVNVIREDVRRRGVPQDPTKR